MRQSRNNASNRRRADPKAAGADEAMLPPRGRILMPRYPMRQKTASLAFSALGATPDSLLGMPRPRLLRLLALVEELQRALDLTRDGIALALASTHTPPSKPVQVAAPEPSEFATGESCQGKRRTRSVPRRHARKAP